MDTKEELSFTTFLSEHSQELEEIDCKIDYTKTVYPSKEYRFRALEECPVPRVVILGQDPYHDGSADGLAFSSSSSKFPKSLINIKKTLEEQGYSLSSPNLSSWAKQGVLLINTSFSVEKGKANSHSSLWKNFTPKLVKFVSDTFHPIWLLWGKPAQSYMKYIGTDKTYTFIHPSPLNGNKFVLENREKPQFLKVNRRLKKRGFEEINWST